MSDQNSSMKPIDDESLRSTAISKALSGVRQIHQQVMTYLLYCEEYTWKYKEVRELAKEYFDTSLEIVEFYVCLHKYAWNTLASLLKIKVAIESDEEEEVVCGKFLCVFLGQKRVGKKYSRTLKALENFKADSDPFTKELVSSCDSVIEKIASLVVKLEKSEKKLDKKKKSAKAWRKVWKVLYVAVVVFMAILTGAALVPGTPPSLKAWAAALPGPVDHMVTKWVASLLESPDKLELQYDIVKSMLDDTHYRQWQLKSIQKGVNKLVPQIKSYLGNADLALTNKKGRKSVVDVIKNRLGKSSEGLAYLSKLADEESQKIKSENQAVWDKIRKP